MRSGQVPINFVQLAQPNSDGCRPIPVPWPNWLSAFKVLSKGMASLVVRSKHRQKSEAPAEKYGEDYLPAVAHQLRVLIADLVVFLADLGHAIEGR